MAPNDAVAVLFPTLPVIAINVVRNINLRHKNAQALSRYAIPVGYACPRRNLIREVIKFPA